MLGLFAFLAFHPLHFFEQRFYSVGLCFCSPIHAALARFLNALEIARPSSHHVKKHWPLKNITV